MAAFSAPEGEWCAQESDVVAESLGDADRDERAIHSTDAPALEWDIDAEGNDLVPDLVPEQIERHL